MTSLPQSPPTTTLSFSYTVGCENADGIKLSLTGVSGIRDAAGNVGVHKDDSNSDADAGFANLAVSFSSVSPQRIDNREPTVASVRLDTAESAPEFGNGDNVEVAVEFTEPVFVKGDPLLRMHLNATTDEKRISYVSGSGTYTLLFRWRVPAGEDGNDLQIPENALVLAGGASIADSAGNAADNTEAGTTGRDIVGTVDSKVPTIDQANIATETVGDGVGDTIDFNVPIIEDGTAALVVTALPRFHSASVVAGVAHGSTRYQLAVPESSDSATPSAPATRPGEPQVTRLRCPCQPTLSAVGRLPIWRGTCWTVPTL